MAENRVLLVEGTDDLHVLAHIFKAHGHEGKITIRDQEGVDKVKRRLDENIFDNLLEDLSTICVGKFYAGVKKLESFESLKNIFH